MEPSDAAGHQNVALAPGLHVGQEGLDGLDGPQEVHLQDLPHGVQALRLQGSDQPHSCITH